MQPCHVSVPGSTGKTERSPFVNPKTGKLFSTHIEGRSEEVDLVSSCCSGMSPHSAPERERELISEQRLDPEPRAWGAQRGGGFNI